MDQHGAEKIPFRIKVLRAANPMMMWLLGSPLHRLMSRDLLVMRFRGRKSGRQFSTPLSYVEVGGRLYLVTRRTVANWWRNMLGGAAVEVVWRGQKVSAQATVLESSGDEAEIGFRRFLSQNPGTASLLYQVDVGREGQLVDEDVRREIKDSIIVRVELEGSSPPIASSP